MNKVFKIYKIQFPNGKVYIGQTYNIKKRWNEHLNEAKRGNDIKVYRAMRKYNITISAFSIIEENILTQESANLKEIYYIAKYDSWHNGYNCGPGGNNGWQPKGENHPNAILTDEELLQLRLIRASKVYTMQQVFEFYKNRLSYSGFQKDWDYQSRPDIGIEYNTEELKEFYSLDKRMLRGEGHFLSKLTNKQVLEARIKYWINGVKMKDIYQEYSNLYSLSGFRKIILGDSFTEVPMPQPSSLCKKKKLPLKKETVLEIKELLKTKTITEVVNITNVPRMTVYRISTNKCYKNY